MKHVNHITHFEDAIIDEGLAGVSKNIRMLEYFIETFRGDVVKHLNVSVKWDGAPSLFAGRDPSTGEFFVAKKSIFNRDPIVYKTEEDIENDITDPRLVSKMKTALKHLPKLDIKGVLQGDFLFSKEDVYEMEIMGKSYIAFHPNTIIYAVPKESELVSRILAAELGVVWHTSYRGDTFKTMSANLRDEVSSYLKEAEEVFSVDPTYRDLSGTFTLTNEELNQITMLKDYIRDWSSRTDKEGWKELMSNSGLQTELHRFINRRVKEKKLVIPENLYHEFIDHLTDKMFAEEAARKTHKGKINVVVKYSHMISWADKHSYELFYLYRQMNNAKNFCVHIFERGKDVDTFIRTQSGELEDVKHEGFVAIDHVNDHMIKLVDRYQFSHANFNDDIVKGWEVYSG